MRDMAALARVLRTLPLLLVSPLLVVASAAAVVLTDFLWFLFGRQRRAAQHEPTAHAAASVVIPTWNARDLLEKYLPPLIDALRFHPDNEILIVDNGSSDGSARMLRERFPGVRVLALEKNLGFGGGANAGVREARNDVVVLLNNDMRVEAGFLPPLLEPFRDPAVFSVSCQIFFSDPDKLREETGLTQGWWQDGGLRVRHRIDNGIRDLYPCFYGGGGSCAFDRRKFLSLGGFDPLYEPFYYEDTDLGYQAWKRGWKVFYQPRSVVYHEHRGTIGRRFSAARIERVLKKNCLLWSWKNIHEWRRLSGHFVHAYAAALLSLFIGDSPERANLAGWWGAFLSLPRLTGSRWRARALAVISDTEAFRRPLGGYFRDRFAAMERAPERPRVLFVSPYSICPPVHGGGVFMYQTLDTLVGLTEVHLVVLIDEAWQKSAHDELAARCGSAEFLLRMKGRRNTFGSILPHAVSEYSNADLEWILHRQIYTCEIDVVQLEYTPLGQYAAAFDRIAVILFEHDIYFQSIARGIAQTRGVVTRLASRFEYLRALRWELRMLPRPDRIQVCSPQNGAYLASFLPLLKDRIDDGFRAGIDTARYEFSPRPRRPFTMLFLGSFRHLPNQSALSWFAERVLPLVVNRCPEARLVVVGSDPPPRHFLPNSVAPYVELRGFVDDVREPLYECSVFVCPILSGSGMRVKLLEAFAAGIPVVSTTVGAEGLAETGDTCLVADSPEDFAASILRLFDSPGEAANLAQRARALVESKFDMRIMTHALVESYRAAVRAKRG
jgi:O-antigen biosynthesis protein